MIGITNSHLPTIILGFNQHIDRSDDVYTSARCRRGIIALCIATIDGKALLEEPDRADLALDPLSGLRLCWRCCRKSRDARKQGTQHTLLEKLHSSPPMTLQTTGAHRIWLHYRIRHRYPIKVKRKKERTGPNLDRLFKSIALAPSGD